MDRQVYNILEKYYRNECSPEEVRMLMSYFNTESEQELLNYMMKGFELEKMDFNYDGADKETLDAVYAKLEEQVRSIDVNASPKLRRLWSGIGIAAAVAAIVISAGIYFYNNGNNEILKQVQDDVAFKNDIAPGKNAATLTINNQGKMITLSAAKSGVIINNDKLTYSDGSVVDNHHPESGSGSRNGKVTMVIATTPRGGTYQFILQDGTEVWLNADSKLEFLSDYRNKAQRVVKLTGEAYFEVAKDKVHPFIVESQGQKVEVLGTHFNVNAYKDEGGIKTTLLEGSVKVNDVILKPNQQAILRGSSGVNVKEVDANSSVDWKNGEFICSNEPLSSIMRKVERWYDIEVVYATEDLKNRTFDGSFSRYDNVSRILKTIEFAGTVKFKLQGRKVFVSK
ncbi:FecR family protein [Pedobacter hiemivivus]|uniref:DUF4974 domain-containing protein n=1 Tax=Pedobacter hiemivivus TaxID=2530454 RepID=A0A4R0NDX5_9SPHI|nr:FecR domain-containing protein [Pedobacter hiemivivus]TCC98515.1 DUF4974 domain-containing protein [Pedobacter hiemivivus]